MSKPRRNWAIFFGGAPSRGQRAHFTGVNATCVRGNLMEQETQTPVFGAQNLHPPWYVGDTNKFTN